MQFTQRETKEVKVYKGGYIKEAGAYAGRIVRAYDNTAKSGNVGLRIEFESNEGQSARIDLWPFKKDGDPNEMTMDIIECHLMPLLGLKQLKPKDNDPQTFFDWDIKADVTKRVTSYPQLANKPIGVFFKLGNNGYVELDFFFDAASNKTAHEFLNGLPANTIAAKAGKAEEENHVQKKAETNGRTETHMPKQSYAPAGLDDFYDDIPFN